MAKDEGLTSQQYDILKTLYKVNPKPNAKELQDKIEFIKTRTNTTTKEEEPIGKEQFPAHIQEVFKYYLTKGWDQKKYKNRIKLWEDLDELYYNDPLNARAINLIADETVQADTNMQPIFVEAPKKQKDFILEFFDQMGIYSLIRPTAFNIVKYGNAGWILGMDKTGVNKVKPIDIKLLEDRMEFTPHEVEKQMENNSSFKKYTSLDRVKQLIDSMSKNDKLISQFDTYLLGFQVNGYAIPPWRFLHFRNATDESPFKPFGMPLYVHALSAYKKWDAAMTFQVLARSINFPIEKHTLTLDDTPDIAEKVQRLRRHINQLDAIGVKQSNKEGNILGSRIFTIKNSYDFELISPGIDIGNMGEAKELREERIVATRLPRSIIDENNNGFGEGGSTLVQKWKEFARLIFQIQSIILENLTQLVKLHMVLSGKFKMQDIDFILSMPFPESKNDEIVGTQNSLIGLANTVIDTLSARLLDGGAVPEEVVVSILNKLNIFDQKVVDQWVKDINKYKDKEEPVEPATPAEPTITTEPKKKSKSKPKDEEMQESIRKWDLLEKHLGRVYLRETIDNVIFNSKQQELREGNLGGKHYFSSKNRYKDFDAFFMRESNKKAIKKLKEKEKFAEEVKIEEYKINFTEGNNG